MMIIDDIMMGDKVCTFLQNVKRLLKAADLGRIRIVQIIYAKIWVFYAVFPDRITSRISRSHFIEPK